LCQFEYHKLQRNSAIRPFTKASHFNVTKGVQESQPGVRFLRGIRDLSLESGEFIVIESKENPPSNSSTYWDGESNGRFFVDSLDIVKHPFDQRIPLTRAIKNGLQPFVSPIPNNRPILTFQSSVSVAALHPHSSRKTDFILTLCQSPKLFKIPRETYFSTPRQTKVNIQNPGHFSLEKCLTDFCQDSERSPEGFV
jgi:hypothetical protein